MWIGHRAVYVRRERGEAGGEPISRGTEGQTSHEYLQHEDSIASRAYDLIATAHDTVPAYGNTH